MIKAVLILTCWSLEVCAGDGDWSLKTDLQGLYGNYASSVERDSMYSAGAVLSADYLDRGGFSLGGGVSGVRFKVFPDIRQQSVFGSLRYKIYLDALPGPLTIRIDGHAIYNNDVTGNTDNVTVIAPQISFLNYDRTLYLDAGYTHSGYQNSLSVNQYTATAGFGFNANADWLQVRGYYIDPSNPLRAQGRNSTTAAELKWQHWFAPDNWLALDSIRIGGLVGERIYAVDGDAAVVYNLADIQRGGISLGLEWKLAEAIRFLIIGGQEYYLNNTIQDRYNSSYIYADFSMQW